jgi:protein TonB
MGMEGLVMLKVLVSREGNVLELEVAQSSGYKILDRAAKEAVKNWRFAPTRLGDSAVDEWVQVPMAFRLTE